MRLILISLISNLVNEIKVILWKTFFFSVLWIQRCLKRTLAVYSERPISDNFSILYANFAKFLNTSVKLNMGQLQNKTIGIGAIWAFLSERATLKLVKKVFDKKNWNEPNLFASFKRFGWHKIIRYAQELNDFVATIILSGNYILVLACFWFRL